MCVGVALHCCHCVLPPRPLWGGAGSRYFQHLFVIIVNRVYLHAWSTIATTSSGWRVKRDSCEPLGSPRAMASQHRHDLYQLLGVTPDAGSEEIRKAYREKAKQLHPDRNLRATAAEEFKCLAEAYHVLADSKRRGKHYDTMPVHTMRSCIRAERMYGRVVAMVLVDFVSGHLRRQPFLAPSIFTTAWYDRYGTVSQSYAGPVDALRLFRELFGSDGFTSTSSDCTPSSYNASAGPMTSGA